MTFACGNLACEHLEPCCRELGHDGPCWPWLQIEFPEGIWKITIVNANPDGTAGGCAMRCEILGQSLTLDELHQLVVNKPGYPEEGLIKAWKGAVR